MGKRARKGGGGAPPDPEEDDDGDGAPTPFGTFFGRRQKRFRLRLARYPAAAEQIDRFVGDRPALALDAGVGRGRLGRITRARGLKWFGLDMSVKRLRLAAKWKRYRLTRGDIRALPFRPGTFDVVTCIQVLEHFELKHGQGLARDLGALLKPGGMMLLSVPIFNSTTIRLKRAADGLLHRFGREHLHGHAHLAHFDLKAALALFPPEYRVTDVRGVRLFSLAGKALEDYEWWYRFHAWAGRRFPASTGEINICAVKPGG